MTASVKTDYAATGFTSTTTAGTAIVATQGTNGLSMAVPAYITTYVNDLTSGRAGTGTTLGTTNINATLSANTNGVALSLNVPDVDFNAWNLLGNTSGTTATTVTTQGALYLQGGNNITLSGNSNTIVISAGAGGGTTNQTGPNIAVADSTVTAGTVLFSNANSVTFGMVGSTITASVGGFTASGYNHYNDVVQVAGQVGQGSINFDPINLDFAVQMDRLGLPIAYTVTSNSTGSQTLSLRVGIYTRNAGTLSLLQSTSITVTAANSGSVGSYSLFSGVRLVTIPFTTTLPANDYWIGVNSSTSSSSQNGASISNMLQSNLGSNFVGFFGQSNNTTQQYTLGQGVYSTTTAAMPVSVAFSQIRGSDSNAARPPIVGFYSGTV